MQWSHQSTRKATKATAATEHGGAGKLSRKEIRVGGQARGCLTPEVGFSNGFIVGERLENVSYVQSLLQITFIEPNSAVKWLALLLCILAIQGSNLYPETNYTNRGISLSSSVPPGDCSDSILH
jgi:ubiquinone biosynthesis protein COQ9